MLRIVIVDDEILIREGLARMISKESSEYMIIGTYPDGQHLLDELPTLQIDIVITDIRMPQIDGLELIKRLKVSHPQVRSILMSGFVEFNYAREAIRSSAVDYLLKPINKEQLFELLHQLNEEHRIRRDKEERERSGLLLSLLLIEEHSSSLLSSLTLPQPYFTILVLKGAPGETVCSCADSLRKKKGFMFDILEIQKGLHVWVWYSAKALTESDLQEISSHIRTCSSGNKLHVGTSHSYNDAANLRQAYSDARLACIAGIYNSSNTLHFMNIQEIQRPEVGTTDLFYVFSESLIHELQILNVTQAIEWIHQTFRAMKTQHTDLDQIVRVCQLVEETASKELPEFKTLYKDISGVSLNEQIASCMTFSEIESLFTSRFASVLTKIRSHRLEMSGTAVESVKRWILANYNQHVDLNTLANMVFLTPSYLSKLFKQETGLTLTDYIIEIRLRKAKYLLKNALDLKVHEIGAEVGYGDPAYFNKLFKRVVGVTPNEYKRISIV